MGGGHVRAARGSLKSGLHFSGALGLWASFPTWRGTHPRAPQGAVGLSPRGWATTAAGRAIGSQGSERLAAVGGRVGARAASYSDPLKPVPSAVKGFNNQCSLL